MSSPDSVEMYVCHRGEKLTDVAGQVRVDIPDKQTAREDAIRQCKSDETIEKIHYYRISDDGESRLLLTYENPYWNKEIDDTSSASKGAPAKNLGKPTKQPPTAGEVHAIALWKKVANRVFFEEAAPSEPSGKPPKKRSLLGRVADLVLYE